jgi:hypothetical protein
VVPNNGFFIDAGSKGFLFESNVVCATSGPPLRFNENHHDWHEWRGNYFGDIEANSKGAKAIKNEAGVESEYRKNLGVTSGKAASTFKRIRKFRRPR